MELFASAFIIPSTISIIYLIMMLHRYCYLKSDIVANEIKLNCSLKFRVSLLICDIGIQSHINKQSRYLRYLMYIDFSMQGL